MKLFVALFALATFTSAFTLPAAPLVNSPASARPAAPVAKRLVYDTTMQIKVPGRAGSADTYVETKELTPFFAMIGALFFTFDYCHYQMGMAIPWYP